MSTSKRLFLFGTTIILFALAFIFVCVFVFSQTPYLDSLKPTTTKTLSNEEQVAIAFNNAIVQSDTQPPQGEIFKPIDIQIEGEWAIIEATYVNNLATPTVGEGTVFIGRFTNENWEIAIPGTETYKTWLEVIPESLLSDELKQILR